MPARQESAAKNGGAVAIDSKIEKGMINDVPSSVRDATAPAACHATHFKAPKLVTRDSQKSCFLM